jgi:hypothetical protein
MACIASTLNQCARKVFRRIPQSVYQYGDCRGTGEESPEIVILTLFVILT